MGILSLVTINPFEMIYTEVQLVFCNDFTALFIKYLPVILGLNK